MLTEKKIIRHLDAVASGDVKRMQAEFPDTFLLVKEKQGFVIGSRELPGDVMGYRWALYLTPEESVTISRETALRIKDELGLVRVVSDENGRAWSDAQQSFLNAYRGWFARCEQASSGKRKRMSGYVQHRRTRV